MKHTTYSRSKVTPLSNRLLEAEETVATTIRNINVAGVFPENLRNELTSYVYKPLSESSEEFTMLKTLYDDFLQSGNLDKFYSQFYTTVPLSLSGFFCGLLGQAATLILQSS